MALNLKKLCVGVSTPEELQASLERRLAEAGEIFHTTRQFPRRSPEILDGPGLNGSLYWVINRKIAVRQRILEFRRGLKADGSGGWDIVLDPILVPVHPIPHRAFQGWRYLEAKDAPVDRVSDEVLRDLPPGLAFEVKEFGVI